MKQKYFLSTVLTFFLLTFISCGDPAGGGDESELGSITGTIQDETTGSSLNGVQVTITPSDGFQPPNVPSPVVTDGQGKYTMSNITLGAYSLLAEKQGYNSETQSITVGSGTNTVNIQMDRISSDLVLSSPSGGQLDLGTESTGEFTVSNNGGSSAVLETSNNKSWISITPVDAEIPIGEQRTFQVSIDRSDQELSTVGTYTGGRITLENTTEGTSLQTISLTIEVAKPSFSINNTSIRFESDETIKDVILTNGNQANIFPSLNNLNDLAWLNAEFTGDYNSAQGLAAGDNATFRVTVDRSQLSESVDNQRIQVPATAEGPDPDPVEIGISVIVERAKISVSESELDFDANPDNVEQTLIITNTGNAELVWATTNPDYLEGADWITVKSLDTSIPEGESGEVTVEIDRSKFTGRDTYNGSFEFFVEGDEQVEEQQVKIFVDHEPKLVRLKKSNTDPVNSGSGVPFTVDLELRGMQYYVGDFTIGFSTERLRLLSVVGLDGAITGYGTAVTPAMDNDTRNTVKSANANGSFTVSAGLVKNSAGLPNDGEFPSDGTGRNLIRLTFVPQSQAGITDIELRDVKIYLSSDLNNELTDVAKLESLPIEIK
jgi:hypothetical protein